MITLYGTQRSRALRVSWLLEEMALDWQFQRVDMQRSPEFLALNPCGKVPVLVDDELVLTESAAIMQYLAERYGEGRFLPQPGSHAAGLHHSWVSFIITELEQPLWSIGKHRFALPEELRLEAMFGVAKWEFDKAAAIAETWLASSDFARTGFLFGDKLTVADILLAHTLMWATLFEQTIPPQLAAYRDKLQQRQALHSALEKTKA
ncbi:glutathione S-transferase family protein [Shewanella sp. AS16]|uniref:glutathione S-transferase family protein n=1 Tax=Shewanella sp. AS16 TaxID=2907625 RepID=UPI001F1D54E1|nr:glutathione S-transferase family protein [Shewanella sp. AS16]MCE9685566.1 glutathione S-transferase family protein [Shewanella sp. AS16]